MRPRTVTATRYVTPLREGGSLPAIVEADDDGLYVLKFRGAGQGPKVLVAELIAGELARAAGLLVPEIVLVELDPDLARTEPDPEIQDLIRGSGGLNLGLDYLPGSVTFDPVADAIDRLLASKIVWFDAFITNVDRTVRNTNLLVWHDRVWLIDHGAALYFHHDWRDPLSRAADPFAHIEKHVLLPQANLLQQADAGMRQLVTEDHIQRIVSLIPASWLEHDFTLDSPGAFREAYAAYLIRRLSMSTAFLEEAERARKAYI